MKELAGYSICQKCGWKEEVYWITKRTKSRIVYVCPVCENTNLIYKRKGDKQCILKKQEK